MSNKGTLFVISGPSGVGKGTVLKKVLGRIDNLFYSVSVTTRAPRVGEINGVHYHFISKEEFETLKATDGMYEYVEAIGSGYGTPKKIVMEKLEQGIDVILEIETLGAAKVRAKTECVSIFIAPPNIEELAHRLFFRGTENAEQRKSRMKKCEEELPCMYDYDYIVVNDKIDQTAEELLAIIKAERLKVKNNVELIEKILKS